MDPKFGLNVEKKNLLPLVGLTCSRYWLCYPSSQSFWCLSMEILICIWKL